MAEQYDQNDSPICTICLGGFKNPRTLPCTHSFCELCISEHIVSTVTQPGQNTFNCPVCRYVVEAVGPTEDKSKWVLLLPLRSISEISEETRQQNCHPCKLLEQIVSAQKWCCDCNEALCQNCSGVHSRLKSTAKHKTILIENTENPLLFLETVSDICAIHRDRRIEMYCSDHSSAICNQCLFDNHRKCGRIQLIDGNEDLTKENFDKLKSQITKLQTATNTLIEVKKENKTAIATTFTLVETEALQILTQMKMKLDDLYIEFLKKAGIKQDEIQDELDRILKELGEHLTVLVDLLQKIDIVNSYGSKVQMFLVTKDVKIKIANTVQNMDKLFRKDEHISVESDFACISQILEKIQDLGELPVTRKNTCTEKGLIETMHDLDIGLFTATEPEFSTIRLKLDIFFYFPGRQIRSCIHLGITGNDICAVLFTNAIELVNASTNKTIDTVPVWENPKKLCFDSDRMILYCSCNNKRSFQCSVDGYELEKSNIVYFSSALCGMDFCDGKIYTITNNAILQSEKLGSKAVWITADVNGTGDDIAIDKTSKRFAVSLKEKQEIRFGSVKDNYLNQYTSCRKFNDVVGIAFGPSDILFVAEQPSSIHIISGDEKSVKTLFTELQSISKITDIDVSRDNKKLYVCGDGGLESYDIISS